MHDGGGPVQVVPPDRIARWGRDISASADRIADGLRRRKYVVLFLFSVLYLLATCFRASRKLFWFDELFTLYISRLPDMASVWNALKQGVDFNPPLFYGLTRLSESLFGEGHIATRLPEILGFWIFCLCLFRFVSSRTSVLAGLIAMVFPLVTTAYFYAYEARSYGVVLGFAGMALICWQAATRSRRSNWWALGLFLALLCAILTQTYAILLLVPFGLAEFFRSVLLRRADRGVWLAIGCASSGVLVSLPLFLASKAAILPSAFPASWPMLANSYHAHLGPAVGVFSVALALYFVFEFALPNPPAPATEWPGLALPEIVVLIAFVAMPFFSFLVAGLTGAPFLYRYSISTVAGFGCFLGVVTARRPPVALGVLLVLTLQIEIYFFQYAQSAAVSEPTTFIGLSTSLNAFAHQYRVMEAVPDKHSPIVLLDDLEFLPIIHYAPADVASRLVYLLYPNVFDTNGEGCIRLQRCCCAPGRFAKTSEFLSTYSTFIALCKARSLYRLKYFVDQGADVRIESVSADSFLVSVTFRKNQGASVPLLSTDDKLGPGDTDPK